MFLSKDLFLQQHLVFVGLKKNYIRVLYILDEGVPCDTEEDRKRLDETCAKIQRMIGMTYLYYIFSLFIFISCCLLRFLVII